MNNLAEQLIFEDKAGKNLHLEHIEDEILNYGVDGGPNRDQNHPL